ncbi:MAG: replication-associated recombination protein A [Clostridia bacterium]|nr:replication-associated recombination protein A [Clostridia bacterium]
MYRPLADLVRPESFEDVAGQRHLLGPGGILRGVIESGNIPNMIFYGPSGIGKTTVANIIARRTDRRLHRLNATTAGTGDIKDIIAETDSLLGASGTLLYLDEIQYFNKKQQQSLLEFIENGRITLIASTTENPYFYIYNAILSRCTVFEFKPPLPEEILPVAQRAAGLARAEYGCDTSLSEEVLQHISRAAGGDVRKAINAVEMLMLSGKPDPTLEDAKAVTQRSAMRYDKDGDAHYDILSAFHKSLRGSDPDAALHYLARLLSAGDMISACRRMLCVASEDVGLAYPQAVSITKACVDSAMQLGLPEAQLPLAEACILLATSPKSNSAYLAMAAAMQDVADGKGGAIPDSLRDGHYAGAQKMGHAIGYIYPHNCPEHWVEQQYLPDSLKGTTYYHPAENKLEGATAAYWKDLKARRKEKPKHGKNG